tara:strand:- start:715 stop:1008 length:294 start_codon:yes stop_codon:yes gene_type:complete
MEYEKEGEYYQCPCCDYFTLFERGIYQPCPVCFWEDDGTNIDTPDKYSKANYLLSLREARDNFKRLGVSDEYWVDLTPYEDRFQYIRKKRTLPPFEH